MEQLTSLVPPSVQQTRVFLWAVPRSISTAVFRAMTNKSGCKVKRYLNLKCFRSYVYTVKYTLLMYDVLNVTYTSILGAREAIPQ